MERYDSGPSVWDPPHKRHAAPAGAVATPSQRLDMADNTQVVWEQKHGRGPFYGGANDPMASTAFGSEGIADMPASAKPTGNVRRGWVCRQCAVTASTAHTLTGAAQVLHCPGVPASQTVPERL